ncbi:MAG: hypothetical protein K940chlam9_01152 [Chlamydiae bacterium]|nr:hypothetical protein [Chlamydiota bacterium]
MSKPVLNPPEVVFPSHPSEIASPKKKLSWPVQIDLSGRVSLRPPTLIQKKIDTLCSGEGGVIYRIKKTEEHDPKKNSDRRYVGSVKETSCGNTLQKRLSHYNYEINSTSDARKKGERPRKRHIINALARSPKKFNVAILNYKENISEEDLLKLEEEQQDLYLARDKDFGYNQSRPTKEPLRTKEAREKKPRGDPRRSPRLNPKERKAAKIARKMLSSMSKCEIQKLRQVGILV